MTDTPPRLFATYFDIARYPEGVDSTLDHERWTCRWQYIAMPKTQDMPYHVMFARYQNHTGHRAVWKGYRYTELPNIMGNIEHITAVPNTVMHTPIVVEINLTLLKQYVPDLSQAYKTPWKVIEAARKQAPRFGYSV